MYPQTLATSFGYAHSLQNVIKVAHGLGWWTPGILRIFCRCQHAMVRNFLVLSHNPGKLFGSFEVQGSAGQGFSSRLGCGLLLLQSNHPGARVLGLRQQHNDPDQEECKGYGDVVGHPVLVHSGDEAANYTVWSVLLIFAVETGHLPRPPKTLPMFADMAQRPIR